MADNTLSLNPDLVDKDYRIPKDWQAERDAAARDIYMEEFTRGDIASPLDASGSKMFPTQSSLKGAMGGLDVDPYQVGATYKDDDGSEWVYLGNGKWDKKKESKQQEFVEGGIYQDDDGSRWKYQDKKWAQIDEMEEPEAEDVWKPTLGERFGKSFEIGFDQGPGSLARYFAEKLDVPIKIRGQPYKDYSRQLRADYDRMASFADEEGAGNKILHGAAGLSGVLAGNLLDPANLPVFAPLKGASALKQAAVMGGKLGAYNALLDPVYQGMDIHTGVQDEYDPQRTLLAGGAGGLFGGVVGGVQGLIERSANNRLNLLQEDLRKRMMEADEEIINEQPYFGPQERAKRAALEYVQNKLAAGNQAVDEIIRGKLPPDQKVLDVVNNLTGQKRKAQLEAEDADIFPFPTSENPPRDYIMGRNVDDITDPDIPREPETPEELAEAQGLTIFQGHNDEVYQLYLPGDDNASKLAREYVADINTRLNQLKGRHAKLLEKYNKMSPDDPDFEKVEARLGKVESESELLRAEAEDMYHSMRNAMMDVLERDKALEDTAPLVTRTAEKFADLEKAKVKNPAQWINHLVFTQGGKNKDNLFSLWRATKAERTKGSTFTGAAPSAIDVTPIERAVLNSKVLTPTSKDQILRVIERNFKQNFGKRIGTDRPAAREPMVYTDGQRVGSSVLTMRPEFAGKTTMELVQSGDRTATSRQKKLRHSGTNKDLGAGDIVTFFTRDKNKTPVEVHVKITKTPYKVSEITPEEWSKMEGWNAKHYDQYKDYWHYEFELLSNNPKVKSSANIKAKKKALVYSDTPAGLVQYLMDKSVAGVPLTTNSPAYHPFVWISKSIDPRIAHFLAGFQDLLGMTDRRTAHTTAKVSRGFSTRLEEGKVIRHEPVATQRHVRLGKGEVSNIDLTRDGRRIIVTHVDDIPKELSEIFPKAAAMALERQKPASVFYLPTTNAEGKLVGNVDWYVLRRNTGKTKKSWSRKSNNGYEVSSKGDKRFSAFFARLKDGRTIEEAYQLDVKGYRDQGHTSPRAGKGKPPVNGKTREQLWNEYLGLWQQWAKENPELIADLEAKSKGKVLTDMFATSDINQARALSTLISDQGTRSLMQDVYDISHEFGHSFWKTLNTVYRWAFKDKSALRQLMLDFENWSKKASKSSPEEYIARATANPRYRLIEDKNKLARIAEAYGWRQEDLEQPFKEFFAEQSAKYFLLKQKLDDTILGNVGFQLRNIFSYSATYIKRVFGTDIPPERFMRDFFEKYAAEIDEFATRNAEDVWTYSMRERYNNAGEMRKGDWDVDDLPGPGQPGHIPPDPASALQQQLALKNPDIGFLTGKVIGRLFGKDQFDNMVVQNSPVLKRLFRDIWEFEMNAKSIENKQMFGDISRPEWEASGTMMKRLNNITGAKQLLKELPDKELLQLVEIFQIGAKQRMPYLTTYQTYRNQMTDNQKLAFIGLQKIFKDMYDNVSLQLHLSGKKPIDFHEGWFPAFRGGEHMIFVKNRNGGPVTHVYTTFSGKTLKKAKKWLEEQPQLSYTYVKRPKASWTHDISEAEVLVKTLRNVVQDPVLANSVQASLDQMDIGFGKFGKHHEFRSDLGGFWGDRPFLSDKENARDFVAAISKMIGDYNRFSGKTALVREWAPVLREMRMNPQLENLTTAADTYFNMAVGHERPSAESLDGLVEGISRHVIELPIVRSIFNLDQPAWRAMTDAMSQIFYTLALISRPAFWVSQATAPLHALRAVDRLWADGLADGIGAASYARSWFMLTKPSKDFKDALYWASQNTEIFAPQLVADLNRIKIFKNQETLETLAEVILGQKQSEIGDSFSRLQTFAMMYDALKSKFQGEELWKRAGMETDKAMIAYRTSSRPPIYSTLGNVGQAVAPLTTFAHGWTGNLYGDVIHLVRSGIKNPKLFMPIISTFGASLLISGMMGAPYLVEYELLAAGYNKLAKEAGFDSRLPSVIEFMMQSDVPPMLNDTLLYGAMSAGSQTMFEGGLDIGASMRYTPFFGRYIGQADLVKMLFPAFGFAEDIAGGALTVAQQSAYETFGFGKPVPTAEYTKALNKAAPQHFLPRQFAEMIAGGPDTTGDWPTTGMPIQHGGPFGEGTTLSTTGDMISKFTGGRSMRAAKSAATMGKARASEKTFTEQKQEWSTILVDAYLEQDTDKTQEAISKLSSMGADPSMIMDIIQLGVYKRNTPSLYTYQAGKGGAPSQSATTIRKQQAINKWLLEE